MEDKTIDILGLNETRLDKTITDSQIDIEGYDTIYFAVIGIETVEELLFTLHKP